MGKLDDEAVDIANKCMRAAGQEIVMQATAIGYPPDVAFRLVAMAMLTNGALLMRACHEDMPTEASSLERIQEEIANVWKVVGEHEAKTP
jgi:hypothetical protein